MSRFDRFSYYPPYVPVAQRRREAEAKAKKITVRGSILEPVKIAGGAIASTFWGKEWCQNLESYSDYSNRLPRGRTYARNGSVIHLKITSDTVTALVQGSSLYEVKVTIAPLSGTAWSGFKTRCAGQISSLLDLLQGRLDKGVLQEITRRPGGLFPTPKEILLSCSCPDGASMCKHVAATLYGVGARLDGKPELFFTLRGADMQELITAAGTSAATSTASAGDALAEDDLSALFGVEIETAATPPPAAKKAPAKKAVVKKKPAASKKVAAKNAPAKKSAAKKAKAPRGKA